MLMNHASSTLLLTALLLATSCSSGEVPSDAFSTFGGFDDMGGDGDPDDALFAEPRIRLLLERQYVNAVGDLLGPAAAMAASPRADVTLNGFDAIGAAQLSLTDADIDAYERSAVAVAAAAVADPTKLSPYLSCTPLSPSDPDCMRSFVDAFGLMAWRRPLDAAELDRWSAVGVSAAADFGTFTRGVESVIAGMLQSPNFIYQVELGAASDDGAGQRKLSGYELATRMSFFLLDTTPSATLLEAAAAGELDDADGVRGWAEELLLDPRARLAFNSYFEELLHLRKLAEIAKDPGTYPSWSPELADSMKAETIALIDEIVWTENGDFRDILDAEYTFVDEALADHYELASPGPSGFQKVPVPPGEKRGGIFGHAGLLSVLAHVSSSSPTVRGKFIQERMLCFSIPPPPPGTVTDLPSTEDAKTMRERLALHQEDPLCASCHTIMDPPGLGLENYDGVGKYRTLDNGAPIDALSALDGAPFEGALELGQALREREQFSWCSVLNLYRHATGHVEASGEVERLREVDEAFIDAEYRLEAAIVELVSSRAFRYVGEQN
ncbi:hypothetical protein ENSA5_49790 [Enhygromyxa salina]|uniref:Cellulose-binding domain protein n=1 Tax=Enhygromyxa salina TaxID=215803 RepID=A0A2S9XHJ9_9BACT|nr:DUF1592 domain-containing protein [Enhygromyxa salina]PRP92348.1 hypothetical protein ENSA5_49790 [Enhygromyxa salina]